MLDEDALVKFTSEAPENKRFQPSEGYAPVSDDMVDDVLYRKEEGYCSTNNLRLETALPTINENAITEEMPDMDIMLIDE